MHPKQIWEKISLKRSFIQGLVTGVGWGLGATVGIVILLWALGWIFSFLGGLPVIGNFLADVIAATQEALKLRQIR